MTAGAAANLLLTGRRLQISPELRHPFKILPRRCLSASSNSLPQVHSAPQRSPPPVIHLLMKKKFALVPFAPKPPFCRVRLPMRSKTTSSPLGTVTVPTRHFHLPMRSTTQSTSRCESTSTATRSLGSPIHSLVPTHCFWPVGGRAGR